MRHKQLNKVRKEHNNSSQPEHTSSQKQNVIHVLVCCLDAVHSYLGVVVAACIKWSSIMHGVNPVSHFWVVLDHIDRGQWQGPAVFYTLKNTWTQSCSFFPFLSSLYTVGKGNIN